ncbi:MAG TPA: outer membrane beta-barrel protein, partial [Chryseolinea sp.]
MNLNKIKNLLSIVLLAASISAFGQDSTKTFTLSGSVDAYFHTSFGTENVVSGFQPNAPTTSFANLKGFALGMVNFIAAYQGEKAGFVADVVFGPRGSDAVFNSGGYGNLKGAGSGHIVNQLFAYYKLGDAVTLNMGQFNTFVG